MLGLPNVTFWDLWSPYGLAAALFVAVLYAVKSERISRGRRVSFYTGLLLCYVAAGGPPEVLGHFSFAVHMVKMSVLFMIVPPLMLTGLPASFYEVLAKKWEQHVPFRRLWSVFLRPIPSLLMFIGLFSVYHFPAIFDYTNTHLWARAGYQSVLLAAAFLQWWPIISPFKGKRSLSEFQRILYIFASGFALTPACALIVFAGDPYYATYTDPATWAKALALCIPANAESILAGWSGSVYLWGLSPLEDQKFGGILMKVVQEIVYIVFIVKLFFTWVKREKEQEQNEKENVFPISAAREYPNVLS